MKRGLFLSYVQVVYPDLPKYLLGAEPIKFHYSNYVLTQLMYFAF